MDDNPVTGASGIPIADRAPSLIEHEWSSAMKKPTPRHLPSMIIEVLDAAPKPLTCGAVTHELNLFGIDVKRSAVDRAIGALRDSGRVRYEWVPLERNGIMVTGRIYFTKNIPHVPHDTKSDPFGRI